MITNLNKVDMDKESENILDKDLEDEELIPNEDCEDEVDMALDAFNYEEDGIETAALKKKSNKKKIIPNKEKYKRCYQQDEWRARDFYQRYGC